MYIHAINLHVVKSRAVKCQISYYGKFVNTKVETIDVFMYFIKPKRSKVSSRDIDSQPGQDVYAPVSLFLLKWI